MLSWTFGAFRARSSVLSTMLKEKFMSKGQDSKKSVKKKAEKTMKEKRNDKKEKKANQK